MPSRTQHLLQMLSFVHGVTEADAELLTGAPEVVELLRALYRNRLFTERSGNDDAYYHFHPLFHQFLQHQAQHSLTADVRRCVLDRVTVLLDSHERIDQAVRLLQDQAAYCQLARLLIRHASPLLDAGRASEFCRWVETIPPDLYEQEPWMAYWHGRALIQLAPLRARAILSSAESAFGRTGEVRGQLLAMVGIIDSHGSCWGHCRELPQRIAQLVAHIGSLYPGSLDAELDLSVNSRLALAMLLVAPDAPLLAETAARALRLLPFVANRCEQLAAAIALLRYLTATGDANAARALAASMASTADDASTSAALRYHWHAATAVWFIHNGQDAQAGQAIAHAQALAEAAGIDPLLIQFAAVRRLLNCGELAAARAALDQMRAAPAAGVQALVAWHKLEAYWSALTGDLVRAVVAAHEAIRLSDEEDLPPAQRARLAAFMAACLALQRRFNDVHHWLRRAAYGARAGGGLQSREMCQCVDAYMLAEQGDAVGAARLLGAVLAARSAREAGPLFDMLPQLAARLAALALRHAIEVDYVRTLIVRQRLVAPAQAVPNWPWPIGVRVFGQFELCFHGERAAASGKTQQRPLLLLKALVAAGEAGKNQHHLAGELWPDADDAKSAFNVTIHRLRKLLAGDNTIHVKAGTIRLTAGKVWSDLDALDTLCNEIAGVDSATDRTAMRRLADELLDLYRGPFCDGDDDHWMLHVRERWRGRFLAAVSVLATHLEALAQWDLAILLYRRALDAEPLAELSYRGLMRCLHAQGDPGAAFSAFRHCRNTLSVVLGRTPSPETDRLARELGLIGAAGSARDAEQRPT